MTANMSFEDAYNSVASGASTVLFSQDGDVTKIWYPKEGRIFDNWFSIAYTDGDKNVEIAYNFDTGKFNKVG